MFDECDILLLGSEYIVGIDDLFYFRVWIVIWRGFEDLYMLILRNGEVVLLMMICFVIILYVFD